MIVAGYPKFEPIYAALFAVLFALQGPAPAPFRTASRRWRHWADVPAEQQPAIFQVQPDPATINLNWDPSGLVKTTAQAELIVYCRTEDTLSGLPSQSLNSLLDAVLVALAPRELGGMPRFPLFNPDGAQVAFNVRVEGAINMVEGVTADNAQSVMYIPIKVLVP